LDSYFHIRKIMMNWLTGSKHAEARKLVKQLKDASKRGRAEAELLRMGAEAAPALIEALQTADQSLLPLYQGMLVRMGIVATPALTHSLLNDHPLIRGHAAEVLAQVRDPKAVSALLSALGGEYYTVRGRAARALGEIGDPEAVQPLLGALKDGELEVRIAAVKALGKFKLPETFDSMADLLLEDPQIEARQAAAQALGETRHPQAIPYLMIALRDPFWWYEREQAADALLEAIAGMGTAAVEPLLEALNDSEGTVRRFAAMLLGRIKDSRAVKPLGMALYDTHFEVGRVAAESLAGFGPVGLKVLAEALHHPEAWLRQHAIAGLTLSGDKRIVPVILDMLKDPEREVQKQAIQSLGALKDIRALPALQAIAIDRRDQEMYKLARQAIEELGKE
jgi:HEAT repeat protein